MKTFLYHENGWRMFQAEKLPVKPELYEWIDQDYTPSYVYEEYYKDLKSHKSKIAALKAKSIPVGNPDIIAEVINRSSTHGGTVFTLVNGVANVFTEWPGDVEIKSVISKYEGDPDNEVAILTLPKEQLP